MSDENVESLRRGLDAWRQGDMQTLNRLMDELLSPEFEIEEDVPLVVEVRDGGPV
jgi:ketosteroid isomerase-like protein